MSHEFNWALNGLNRSDFEKLPFSLLTHLGQQVEPGASHGAVNYGEEEQDEDNFDAVTTSPDAISRVSDDELKRQLLDRMAELFSNYNGAIFVTAASLTESTDKVIITLARNKKWFTKNNGRDEKFRKRLQEILRAVASGQDDRKLQDQLRETMIKYYSSRLHVYMQELLVLTRESFGPGLAPLHQRLQALPQNVREGLMNIWNIKSSTRQNEYFVAELGEGVSYAHRMRTTTSPDYLGTVISETQADKLWSKICFLARMQTAFHTFLLAARHLSSFDQLEIKFVRRDILPQQSDGSKQERNVHAEVQLTIYHSRSCSPSGAVFGYLGCSKRSCWLCDRFLGYHRVFVTRGCHGKMYPDWTVPKVSDLRDSDAVQRIVEGLHKTQQEMELLIQASSGKKGLQLEKESSAPSKSFVMNTESSSAGMAWKRADIDRNLLKDFQDKLGFTTVLDHVKREAQQNAKDSAHETPEPSVRTMHEGTASNLEVDALKSEQDCYYCYRRTRRTCSLCGKGRFCSESCQSKMDPAHIFNCQARPLTTADYFYEDLVFDKIPEDPDVCRDFGFDRCRTFDARSHLLGLYQGLRHPNIDIDALTLNEWRKRGILQEKIIEAFETIREGYRGDYFPWFLKNKHLVPGGGEEELQTEDKPIQTLQESFIDPARKYLPPADRDKDIRMLAPRAKCDSFQLYMLMEQHYHPNPIQPIWYDFGFCCCRNEDEERLLGNVYQKLATGRFTQPVSRLTGRPPAAVPRCTFNEFWRAFEQGKLIALMDSRGCKEERLKVKDLHIFLSAPAYSSRPKVWTLAKVLGTAQTDLSFDETLFLADFGFVNCQTVLDWGRLRNFYGKLLARGDPIELDRVSREGKIAEYGKKVLGKVEPDIEILVTQYIEITDLDLKDGNLGSE